MADVQSPSPALASSPRIGVSASADRVASGPATSQPIPVTVQMLPPYAPAPQVHWTAYATAISIPAVAIVAVALALGIAHRNGRIARHRLKLELHDRRMALYERLHALGSNVYNGVWNDTPSAHYGAFVELAREMRWVFSKTTMRFVTDELGRRLQEYSAACQGELDEPDPINRKVFGERKAAVLSWLNEYSDRTAAVFTPDLSLTD